MDYFDKHDENDAFFYFVLPVGFIFNIFDNLWSPNSLLSFFGASFSLSLFDLRINAHNNMTLGKCLRPTQVSHSIPLYYIAFLCALRQGKGTHTHTHERGAIAEWLVRNKLRMYWYGFGYIICLATEFHSFARSFPFTLVYGSLHRILGLPILLCILIVVSQYRSFPRLNNIMKEKRRGTILCLHLGHHDKNTKLVTESTAIILLWPCPCMYAVYVYICSSL